MKTIKVTDGDFDVPIGTGIVATVDDLEKAGQDVARHLLCEFNSFFYEGNELLTSSIGTPGTISETVAASQITEAINRLIAKQVVTDGQGRIIRVTDVRTRIIDLSTLIFLAEVLFEDGQVASVVKRVDLKPTSLRQQGVFD